MAMGPGAGRSNYGGTSKSIIGAEDADKVAVVYSPRKFPSVITSTAKEFVSYQASLTDAGTDPVFRIDKIVAEQTGVAELERASIEERVEREAIERLKELQEQAYQQAYNLGLDEGREKALLENQQLLEQKVAHLEQVISSIETLKSDLINFNESHIVKLVFYMARRVVMGEIQEKPELVLSVIQQAIQSAQSDEKFTVRVSQADFEFIEQIKERLGKEFEVLKSARIEASEEISNGGCVIETNYGDVDATVEQRLETLWSAVAGKLPKVKDSVSSEDGNGQGNG